MTVNLNQLAVTLAAKMQENPVIADWVHLKGGITEGLLGGWLAQRQAALRGMVAAGARCDFTLVSRACRNLLEHLACHRKAFPGNLDRLSISEAGRIQKLNRKPDRHPTRVCREKRFLTSHSHRGFSPVVKRWPGFL